MLKIEKPPGQRRMSFVLFQTTFKKRLALCLSEAMAAGLPVVVSDWDGYKDTVRDGVDGFRIPNSCAGPRLSG